MLIVDTDTKVTQNIFHILLKITLRFYLSIMSVCQCYSYLLFMNSMITIFGPASARSFKIGVVGNNNWLVGNAVFSERALRIFLTFCVNLGGYKGRKVTELDFWEKFLIWRYSRKGLQISPKSVTDIFLKNGSNDFFGFCPEVSTKYDPQFE